MSTGEDQGADRMFAGGRDIAVDQWRLEVATRDGTLDSPDHVGDRVLSADVGTLESMFDILGPEGWRAMLALLRRYSVAERRSGGRRVGVVHWGAGWVQRNTGLGNRPSRRAVNALETAGLVVRDELPHTVGAAGQRSVCSI